MTPPLFVWKSGVLDVFDSADELAERYAAHELAGEDAAMYDGKGRLLRALAEKIGCAFITLVAVLAAVGVGVGLVGLYLVAAIGV